MGKAAVLFCLSISVCAAQNHWVATWSAAPAPQLADEAQMRAAKLQFHDQTLREIVHTSIGGSTIRLQLSNAYGKETLRIAAVHVALREKGSAIVADSDRSVTFSGSPTALVPRDAIVISDPVKLNVPAVADLAVSIYLKDAATGAGTHYSAQQTSYIAAGDQTSAATMDNPTTLTSWVFLTGVAVLAPQTTAAVVAFGDSITDGSRSTLDANRRWPNILADRLQAAHRNVAVVDAGIGGNRILHDGVSNVRFGVNALARFERDVLAQPGVKYVIVLEGINDVGHAGTSAPASETVTAEEMIAGLKQMIERAHTRGIKIFGATLTPFEGTVFPGYFTPEKEVKRKAVNEWIRSSKAFDGVVDFDKAVRDPKNTDHILPAYDGGDHLHPGDAGYKAMGEAVELKLFR